MVIIRPIKNIFLKKSDEDESPIRSLNLKKEKVYKMEEKKRAKAEATTIIIYLKCVQWCNKPYLAER